MVSMYCTVVTCNRNVKGRGSEDYIHVFSSYQIMLILGTD